MADTLLTGYALVVGTARAGVGRAAVPIMVSVAQLVERQTVTLDARVQSPSPTPFNPPSAD